MAKKKKQKASAKTRVAVHDRLTPKLMPQEQERLSWRAPEFIHHEKGTLWFIIATIAAFALIINAILNKQWTTAIVFALLLGVVYLLVHEKPQLRTTIISNLGIHIGHRFFPYADIKSFWLIYHEGAQTFNFQVHGTWGAVVTTQLGNQDPAQIRALLRSEVAEEENKYEPLLDKLSRWLKI